MNDLNHRCDGCNYLSPLFPTPSQFTVPNKRVALEPFPTSTGTEVVNGVLRPKNQAALIGLKVVFGNDQFHEGAICYVRADKNRTTLWGKEVLEVDGKKFLLVPEEEVVLMDRYGGVKLNEFTVTSTQSTGTP